MGILIAIDGVDASGKGLQTGLICKKLSDMGLNVKKLTFPDYEAKSCEPVKMYLNGEFGSSIDSVNAYAASVFFAVDRYASYKLKWKEAYDDGTVIVCDRYVTSNAIHQSVKVNKEERDSFLKWIDDLEYNKMDLPRPNAVFFLDMPVEISLKLMAGRYNGDDSKKDIHEMDSEYLVKCHEAAQYACKKYGWYRIECVREDTLRTPEDINNEIMGELLNII